MEFGFYLFQSVLSFPVFLIFFYHNFSTGVHRILGAEGVLPLVPFLAFLSPLDLPLQSGYYLSETVAYPKYRQDLTPRGAYGPWKMKPHFRRRIDDW